MKSTVQEASSPEELVQCPLVSVLMITYNHAEYLADAIEGVVRQECSFPFELIIGEDASSDATLSVALEYQARYPAIVRVIHSEENVGMNANALRIFARARGEYVAYCEGDDYWCVSDKLARQVALIGEDSRIGIVHSDWTRAHCKGGRWMVASASMHERVAPRYLQGNLFQSWYFPKILRTCTILLRRSTMRDWYDSGLMDPGYPFGDTVLSAWITSRSEVAYLPVVMAVYRVSANSALRSGADSRVRFYEASLRFDAAARTFFAGFAPYPSGYRWESAAALLVWGFRARSMRAMRTAAVELATGFSISECFANALKSVRMRLPAFARRAASARS